MKVAICRSPKAYLPETDAYEAYLVAHGVEARCVDDRRAIRYDEIAIVFRFEDQMARDIAARRRIHEEHNIPVGWRGWLRSTLLRAGPRPDGQIRLAQAHDALPRPDCPTLVRSCGIDAQLFDIDRRAEPEFDLVYCGSLDRPGVIHELFWLALHDFTVAVYGRLPPGMPQSRLENEGVTFFGPISREEVPAALANARAGLNVTPDQRPWNVQESMKTLEYLAAGLPVVSNRYPWIEQFADERGADILWLDDLGGPGQLRSATSSRVDMNDREWTRLLDEVGFIPFLQEVDA